MWKLSQKSFQPDPGEREQQMANLKARGWEGGELKSRKSEIKGGKGWKGGEPRVPHEQIGVNSILLQAHDS